VAAIRAGELLPGDVVPTAEFARRLQVGVVSVNRGKSWLADDGVLVKSGNWPWMRYRVAAEPLAVCSGATERLRDGASERLRNQTIDEIAAMIRAAIEAGEFDPVEPLPTVGEWCQRLAANRRNTIWALQLLEDEGVLFHVGTTNRKWYMAYEGAVGGNSSEPERVAVAIVTAIRRGELLPGQQVHSQEWADRVRVRRLQVSLGRRLLAGEGVLVAVGEPRSLKYYVADEPFATYSGALERRCGQAPPLPQPVAEESVDRPEVVEIARAVRRAVKRGEFLPGQELPAPARWAARLDRRVELIPAAFRRLERLGVLVAIHRGVTGRWRVAGAEPRRGDGLARLGDRAWVTNVHGRLWLVHLPAGALDGVPPVARWYVVGAIPSPGDLESHVGVFQTNRRGTPLGGDATVLELTAADLGSIRRGDLGKLRGAVRRAVTDAARLPAVSVGALLSGPSFDTAPRSDSNLFVLGVAPAGGWLVYLRASAGKWSGGVFVIVDLSGEDVTVTACDERGKERLGRPITVEGASAAQLDAIDNQSCAAIMAAVRDALPRLGLRSVCMELASRRLRSLTHLHMLKLRPARAFAAHPSATRSVRPAGRVPRVRRLFLGSHI
jgi:DNA-binding transcriptional regulator YhcF (GntR family)